MATSNANSRLDAFVQFKRRHQMRNIRYFKQILRNLWTKEGTGYFNKNPTFFKHPVERAVWWIVHIVAVVWMSFVILDTTLDFQSSPTVTTTETSKYPVQNINYPAIAICSINRISHSAAVDLAEELLEFETTTYNVNLTAEELTDILKVMGHLYLFESNDADAEKVKLLHMILERGYGGYDVSRIMKRLSPKCRSTLKKCSWKGKDQACDDLFFLRKTGNGFCCTFNYARLNDGFGKTRKGALTSQPAEHSTNIGPQYGLSVLLNPRLDDYAYKTLPSDGFEVLVYSPLDFPDTVSGGLREVFVPPRSENFLDLSAVTFYSTLDVKDYGVRERDCLFNTEQSKIFFGYYSFTDCIMHCRTQDIYRHCKCIPFFYPLTDDTESARICNLKDLPCLRRYRERRRDMKPRFEKHMEPFDENDFNNPAEYLSCDCLPSCADLSYSVSTNSIPLSAPEIYWDRTKFTVSNHSILHIFFGTSGVVRLKQDVLFYWYELMSNYGGICSLFLGISILNLVEILFTVMSWFLKDKASKAPVENNEKAAEPTSARELNVQTVEKEINILYWNEIAGPLRQQLDLSKLTSVE